MLLNIDLKIIKSGLENGVPGLDFNQARVVGNGFRSLAVEAGNRYIFLIGKHEEATATYAREYRLLPKLGRHLTIKIPHPKWFKNSTAEFPHGFMGYEAIAGKPLAANDIPRAKPGKLVQELAKFFRQIHSFPTEEARGMGVPCHANFLETDRKLFEEVLPILKRELAAGEMESIKKWWHEYQNDPALRNFTPAFIHGDLWHDNIIVNGKPEHIGGVIDFESREINDPAKDFAPLFYLGAGFAHAVISSYLSCSTENRGEFRNPVMRHWQRRNLELEGIRYAVTHNDATELSDALAKIRKGPILSGAST